MDDQSKVWANQVDCKLCEEKCAANAAPAPEQKSMISPRFFNQSHVSALPVAAAAILIVGFFVVTRVLATANRFDPVLAADPEAVLE